MEDKLFEEILDHGFEAKLKSRISLQRITLYFLGTLGSIIGSYLLLKKAFEPPYLDLAFFPFGIFLIFIAFFCLFHLINSKKYIFTKDNIYIQSTFSRKRKLDLIEGFGIRYGLKRNKEKEEDEIGISHKNGLEILGSDSIANFYTIKKFLENNYTNLWQNAFNKENGHSLESRFMHLFFLLPAIFFLGIYTQKIISKSTYLNGNNSFIELTLASAPKILTRSKSKKIRGYTLKSKEYPNYEFSIEGESFNARLEEIDHILKRGDKISIGINSTIYQFKILKNKEVSFWVKHFN